MTIFTNLYRKNKWNCTGIEYEKKKLLEVSFCSCWWNSSWCQFRMKNVKFIWYLPQSVAPFSTCPAVYFADKIYSPSKLACLHSQIVVRLPSPIQTVEIVRHKIAWSSRAPHSPRSQENCLNCCSALIMSIWWKKEEMINNRYTLQFDYWHHCMTGWINIFKYIWPRNCLYLELYIYHLPVVEYLVWWLSNFYQYSIQEQIAKFSYADTSRYNCHGIWYSLFPCPLCELNKINR